jgi:hypothetical protein
MNHPPRVPDELDWFKGTWEGNALSTLQDSWRMTFRQKLEWLEDIQILTERWTLNRKCTLRHAMRQWAD